MKQMMNFVQKIEHFLVSQTIWIFITGILFVCLVMVNESVDQSWGNYLIFAVKLILLFSPVLVFSLTREWLKKRLHTAFFLLLWGLVFMAYPWLIETLDWQVFLAPPDMDKWMVRAAGTVFLFSEVVIQLNNYWLKNSNSFQWFKRISLERGILFFLAFFALVYAWVGGWSFMPDDKFNIFTALTIISYAFQIFFILMVYYGFYLINHYFLIAKIWKRKGVIYYGFALIGTIVLLYPVAAQLIMWMPVVRQTDMYPFKNGRIFSDINAFIPFFGLLLSIPFILAIKWFKQNTEIVTLAKEKSETELNLLKQQINPHFFFNTLNNLYALSLIKDERTPEVILQLSELMRYVIKKGKEEHVTLAEEIKYIEDYIWLQQIRLHKNFDFRFEKHIENEHLQIPPLLFINLVENAFKHGIEPAEKSCFLRIYLKSSEHSVDFTCENSWEEKLTVKNGSGLQNLRRRLELRFPGRHDFQVTESLDKFKANLTFVV